MNRNNIYTVNPLYNGSTTQSTGDDSVQSGGTTIIYQQGGGTGLTDAQKQKLDGIQEGAEVNQNAYSKVRLNGSDTLIIEAKNKTDILNMSGVYPIAIAINGSGGLDFTVSSDQTNTNAVVTQSQLQAAIEKLQEDKYWKVDEDGKLYTELDVYSHKEISAYGAGTGGGSTGGAGALYECADVLRDGDKVQGAAVGSILSYNGSHWYAIPQSAITPDLTNYATKSYVTQQINDLIGGAPGTLDTLKEIAEALGNNPNFATTVTEMINNIGLRVDQVEDRVVSLEDMFEWDKSASASDPSLWRIKAKKDLYGVGEISAYGYSSGTVPTGAQYMYELKDVLFTELTSGQLLQWNGTKWINIDKNAVGLNETELAKYLTNNNYAKKSDITWANLLNKPTTWGWANITGKPTTLAGYGITDGVSNTRRVSAGSGLAGGGVLSSDVTISLGTIGTAGTYTKITTDMYGRVVSGTTLSESDIPTLQISKISGLQSALNSKLNISDFNTWFTIKKDSQGRIVSIQANYDFFSVGEISAYGLGETQPSVTTLAGLDDVTITSPANGQTLIYDSATSQWKNGTIIGGGNISLNGTVYKPVDGVITLPNLKPAERTWFSLSNGNSGNVQVRTTGRTGYYEFWDTGAEWALLAAKGYKTPGGTSSQFLKADGSVDSNVYLTQSSTDTRYVLKTGDTMTGNLIINSVNGNILIGNHNSWNGDNYPTIQSAASDKYIMIPFPHINRFAKTWGDTNSIIRMEGPSLSYYDLTIRDNGFNILYNNNYNNPLLNVSSDGKAQIKQLLMVNYSGVASNNYNEGIRICIASNGWSNIQFGTNDGWEGKIDGQWLVGKNPANYFQICMAGTETANTTRPSKGFSIDTNGYLHTGYISVEINTDNQGDYFYSSNDAFLRRSAWYDALSHLSNKQRTLDLTSLDQNKWYPCIIGASAHGGTPLRITLFNGLRGNKPTWGSHQQGFSLLLDYEVTGSGWGTLAAIAKLNWYFGSFGGETAFGGRQQNTMASTEIIYLRGGGIYYYRTTNGLALTVQPNGYTWSSGSYNYSAPVKTSQDNSPMEKTFDQVYWAPNNLRNTRTIWGQSFNGTQNVSGALQNVTTINASSTIYTGGDIIAYSRLFCGGYLYVHRNAYSADSAPSISLAIGDTDTGFNWDHDGYINFVSNAVNAGHWGSTEARFHNAYFRIPSGNDYSQLGIMVNGNGTANTIKPGIGFHQPGVFAGSIRMNDGSTFGLYAQGGSGLANLSLNGWYTNFGYINGDGIHLSSGWLRTVGDTGWYNETYAGGMYMADGTWIRTYNGRKFYVDNAEVDAILTQGGFRSNGNSQVGLQIDGSESTRTIIYGKIGSIVNSVVARYAVNWYSEWARFDVHRGGGTDILKFSWKHNDTELMYLGMGGYFQVNGTIVSTGEVTAYSDIRLKTNIKPLDYKGRLAPKWFIKDNKPSIGFIAQEVQALYPELVKVNTSTIENYLSLNYGAITAVLSAQVNKVEDEVEVLKNRIRQLENEVALLKQKP